MDKAITILDAQAITTAVTGTASTAVPTGVGSAVAVTLTVTFVYGSGGTTLKVWIQTSLDGGTTWIDIACMTATTSSKVNVCNLSGRTPVTTLYAPLDGTLADDTCKDGIVGPLFRTKRTTTGTYAGGTTLSVVALVKA